MIGSLERFICEQDAARFYAFLSHFELSSLQSQYFAVLHVHAHRKETHPTPPPRPSAGEPANHEKHKFVGLCHGGGVTGLTFNAAWTLLAGLMSPHLGQSAPPLPPLLGGSEDVG